jgi:hypothetical protein
VLQERRTPRREEGIKLYVSFSKKGVLSSLTHGQGSEFRIDFARSSADHDSQPGVDEWNEFIPSSSPFIST